MDDDFARLDFILTPCPVDHLATVLATLDSTQAAQGAPAKRGLLSRLTGRGANAAPSAPPYLVQSDAMQTDRSLRHIEMSDKALDSAPLRLSGPYGPQNLALIEYVEASPLPADGTAPFATALSRALGDAAELYYFQTSGARHPGIDLAFHVYAAGQAIRRCATQCLDIEVESPNWQAVNTGIPHPLETGTLLDSNPSPEDVMTGERQAAILAALGLEPEMLFDPAEPEPAYRLWLARLPTGQRVEEAVTEMAKLASQEQQATDEPAPESGLAEQSPPDPDPASLPSEPPDAPSQNEPEPDKWETDVTAILIEAVEAALPEDQQVAWLDGLTAQLIAGEIDAALIRAHQLIDAGDRPPEARAAASARLAALFGRATLGDGAPAPQT